MPYVTKQYQAVLQCLENRRTDAFTAAELAEDLRQAGHPVGLATVYRQLEKLETAGVVHRVPTEEGSLYQRCPHPDAVHGCFLLRCGSCGRIVHLDCAQLEALVLHLETAHHFRIDPRQTVLTGQCRDCAAQEASHGTT